MRTASDRATLVALLRFREETQGSRHAFSFLSEDGTEQRLTYAELDRQARQMAVRLQRQTEPGARVLLLFQPGLDYLISFFGALYAGAVPVPAYPPRQNGNLTRLLQVAEDAQATAALTTEPILRGMVKRLEDGQALAGLQWITAEGLDEENAGDWQELPGGRETLAFLQYTSGSTSAPKGVMLTHGNLLHNLQLIESSFGTTPDSRGVVWLPPYHDMGLIGGILQPVFTGYPMTLLAPVDFITKPLRWLQAITETGATVSGGPNFAYELCLQKIGPEERAGLDLSRWEQAFTGAEPVRAETMRRFAEVFASCGFRQEAFYPCYGLAEGTLLVTGGSKGAGPVVKRFDAGLLAQHQALETTDGEGVLVSSGRVTRTEQKVRIVDPQSQLPLTDGMIGEIWVQGESVAQGYWNREEQTEATFRAQVQGEEDGAYLRTGDLGFVSAGELFVTGRMKDLIIVNGRNHYPQDIEFTVQNCHPGVGNSNGAAFAVDGDGGERLVVVQEVERTYRRAGHEEIVAAIRQAVALQHGLPVEAVVLLKPASIPKTSSGKIQRHACKARYLDGTLEILTNSQARAVQAADAAEPEQPGLTREDALALPPDERAGALAGRLLSELAQVTNTAALPADKPLAAAGLDSLMAVELKNRLEEAYHVPIDLARLLEGATAEQLAAEIAAGLGEVREESVATDAGNGLSYGQRSLWFLQQLDPSSTAYHISKLVKVRGPFDADRLQACLQTLHDRHELLRTVYPETDGQPTARLVEAAQVDFANVERAEELTEAAQQPFDLAQGPLFRARLHKSGEQEHLLLLSMHHIIADLWSLAVLIGELRDLYAGTEDNLTDPAAFADYVRWQNELLASKRGDALWAYWQGQLQGQPPVLNLPTDRPRPPVQTYRGATLPLAVPGGVAAKLRELSKQEGATLYMTLLAAFQTLLHRYAGQEEIWVGSPTAGRSAAKFQQVFGYFVNPVVLRADVRADEPFRDLLRQVRATVLGALSHADYPFPLLVERLAPQRDLSAAPLFQAMFSLQKAQLQGGGDLSGFALSQAGAELCIGDVVFESVPLAQGAAQFDLTLSMVESADGLSGTLEFNTDLFDPETAESIVRCMEQLLAGIAAHPDWSVGSLPLVNANDASAKITVDAGQVPYPAQCLHQLFEAQAGAHPAAEALEFDGRILTYRELNERANAVAHSLIARGVRPGDAVGLSLPRTAAWILGMLGVLKAGGAYLPLDPVHPEARLQFMAQDAGAQIVLDDEALWQLAERTDAATHNPALPVTPEQTAYLIYTSGTTGTPKGVACPHRGAVNLLAEMERRAPLPQGATGSVWTSFGFDVSVYEVFSALCYGHKLIVLPEDARADGDAVLELFADLGVSSAYLPPFLLPALAAYVKSCPGRLRLTRLLVGVEPIRGELLQEICQHLPGLVIVNGYGPTEASVCATLYTVSGQTERIVPIGTPLPHTEIWLLDASGQPVPQGVIGELHIGGAGLAHGYIGRPELTAEKFVQLPVTAERLYKTGDLARLRRDGMLEYCGRSDDQVKVRGFRIELGEIEAAIAACAQVQAAAVSVREDAPGGKRIVGYVVWAEADAGDIGALRRELKQKLPDYMVPSAFVALDALPQTVSGKVDRRALPAPQDDLLEKRVYTAPRNEQEAQLCQLFAELLGVAEVGVHDHFFERGGHSLLATQALTRVESRFGVKLPLSRLFEAPTPAELAVLIGQTQASAPVKQKPKIGRVDREARRQPRA
ncbi:non-ribosomal peptide synthetase [Tumebacillus sp. BK434]|uniref:non-ribosomal peptide synthetase n=1 Tax=Tumebacillus sp. BK434 TaxID=2512169 RepID=UPI0010539C42|nr:non-ribosomal peptide synthetase [Tumebacillus sp. BK434]